MDIIKNKIEIIQFKINFFFFLESESSFLFLLLSFISGFPSITIPCGFIDDLPVGLNITGNVYDDVNVLNIAYALESAMPYKNQIAKEKNYE